MKGLFKYFVLFTGSLVATLSPAAEPTVVEPMVSAVWKEQSIEFSYWTNSVYQSCGELRRKVRGMLLSLGARADLQVLIAKCRLGEPTNSARFRIRIATPLEATEANLQDLTDYDSREVLIARALNKPLLQAQDLPRIEAYWRTVSVVHIRGLHLDGGDCDLIKAMWDQVLPQLQHSIKKRTLTCRLSTTSRDKPTAQVLALVAVSH